MSLLALLTATLALNVFPNTPCFSNVRTVVQPESLCFEVTHSDSSVCSLRSIESAPVKLRVMPYNESVRAYMIDMGFMATNVTRFCHPGRYYNVLTSRLIFSIGDEEWLVIKKKSIEMLKTVLKTGTGPVVDDSMSGKIWRAIWYEPIDGSTGQSALVVMEPNDWDYYDFNFNPVQGIHDAILTMQVGERAVFYIPYNQAFGEAGSNRIPPRAQVILEFEIFEAFPRQEDAIVYENPRTDDD